MKKFLALLLVLSMCLTVCLGAVMADEDPLEGVTAAKKYLRAIYKDNPEKTAADYVVTGVIRIGTDEYPVTWTTNCEEIAVVPSEDGKTVVIDINERAAADTEYILTGTVTDAAGNALSVDFKHLMPKGVVITRYDQIVDLAYGLEAGETTPDMYRLCGTIIAIPTPWSEEYKNITVDMVVDGMADKPIECYRLTGEGCADLKIGDVITAEGYLTRYNDTREFAKNCVLVGMGEILDQSKTVAAAYELEAGAKLTYPSVLKGTIISIPSAWSDQYQNITVDMVVDGMDEFPIECYRLAGEGAADLKVGDEIAVFGTLTRYNDTREFGAGCKLIPADRLIDVKNVLDAYQLEPGETFGGVKTLTGVVSSIASNWSDEYQNISIYMVVAGLADYPVECYRLSGEGAKDLAVGDTVTVTGTLTRYQDTFEFNKGCTLDAVVKAN